MKWSASCVLLFVAVSLGLAEPPTLVIPTNPQPVNGYVIFTPTGTAKGVSYVSLTPGVSPLPTALLADKKVFALPVGGLAEGKYSFVATGSLNDEHTQVGFTVTIGTPPDPDNPPTPPTPVDSELTKIRSLLKAAWEADKAAGSTLADVKNLQTAMTAAASTATNQTYSTRANMIKQVNTDTLATVGRGKLLGVGAAVGAYMDARFGTTDGTLTDPVRQEYAKAYKQVASALASLR
jgi:hypothetical protein